MAENSKIEWCDHTFNPWEGCTKVSPGCAHCYAEARNRRFAGGVNWGPGAPRRHTSPANWKQPLAWEREAADLYILRAHQTGAGEPIRFQRPRVFCASLADWLDDEVPAAWLAELLDLIRSTPHLDWLLLTKRPQLWRPRMEQVVALEIADGPSGADQCYGVALAAAWLNGLAPANVWVGTTVEDQTRADERIPALLEIPAVIRFLSCEPLLGALDIEEYLDDQCDGGYILGSAPIHWVICGGESGPKARPMHPAWARELRDQCASTSVPFLFKQWGEWLPCERVGDKITCTTPVLAKQPKEPELYEFYVGNQFMARVGKAAAGRLLDGIEHTAFPEAKR